VAESRSEVETHADFSIIRYAQCWEDADTLLEALDVQPGDACLSVGSGGENTLSLLSRAPGEVISVDLSPAQNAVVELKAAGFRVLSHAELLELVGIRAGRRRLDLFGRVRSALSSDARRYWDGHRDTIEQGLVAAGKFEHYFALFRRWILPLIHDRHTVAALLEPRDVTSRRRFYDAVWNTWRWRALFRLFFSRRVMGRLGRDPRFFDYVQGDVAGPIFDRTEHAITDLDPTRNPYLQFIVHGDFLGSLPHAWREENFEPIRSGLDRLRIELVSVEAFVDRAGDRSIDRFNLSDIFEYISAESADRLFDGVARCGRPGGRVAYWNMQVPRQRPERLAAQLCPLAELAGRLQRETTTFFYSAFHVDELTGPIIGARS
jgi:S-adenosylmethionine-diacylglycerol 3-amino-3-carboxypropyl transferase